MHFGIHLAWWNFLMTGTLRVRRTWIRSGVLSKAAIALLVSSCAVLATFAAGPANETALKNAWALYTQQKYRESSDAFEAIVAVSTPSARLYYYAALANRASNRVARAKQLCQYIATNFSTSQEASFAKKLYPDLVVPVVAMAPDPVPESLKGKTTEEMLKTEEGRKYVMDQLAKKEAAVGSSKSGSGKTAAQPGGQVDPSKLSPMMARAKGGKPGARVFTAAEIAGDGPGGIDQSYYPNCWFESSMSSLAALPRGQKLMADMVSFGEKEGTYVVRFLGDGKIYTIDEKRLEKSGVHNKALWATLIECGQTMKFPYDGGAPLAVGLGVLTGQRAKSIDPETATEEEISRFIDAAVKTQNPIICGTSESIPSGMPELVVTNHAYTIIGFDAASKMIKIRNPHGANSDRFHLSDDPRHEKFEQMDDGVFRIHISLFKHYYDEVACANI